MAMNLEKIFERPAILVEVGRLKDRVLELSKTVSTVGKVKR